VQEFFIGEHRPSLLRIPKGVYHGFKCISETEALVVNVPDRSFCYADPDEVRLPAHGGGIPYDWGREDG
jgi:dTDP-4-dehydrorhamnose 3,5-epimerase